MEGSQSTPAASSLMHRDRLSLVGMTFHAHHGYEEHEITNGQRFEIDVEMILDITQAATTDHLSDAVDYRRVYRQIQDIVLKQRFYLIETLSLRVATTILENFPIAEVTVRVRKPVAPLGGLANGTQIEITRVKT
jgi:dihydroneopterin aldolase